MKENRLAVLRNRREGGEAGEWKTGTKEREERKKGTRLFWELFLFTVGRTPFSVAVADLDADGWADVVTANIDSGDVSVLLGNGDGTFLPGLRFAAEDGAESVALVDLDGDGRLDLAVSNVFALPFGSRPSRNVSVLIQ